MKKLNAGAKKILCANDTSPFRYYAWPSITRLPDGTLAMAASGLRLEHICPFGKGVIAYSRDEGETWTEFELFYKGMNTIVAMACSV